MSSRSSNGGGGGRAPPPLRKLLDLDLKLTNNVVTFAYSKYPQLSRQPAKSFMNMLEISCHGVPWIALSLIAIYMFKSTHNVSVNLLLALLYDIVIVATIKAITRRPRPPKPRNASPMFLTIGPDKLSFPSGHASRAVLLTFFVTYVSGSTFLWLIFSAWTALIAVSRVLMRRHHVLDVICGLGLGVIEWALVYYLWAGESASSWIGKMIGGGEDEFDGA